MRKILITLAALALLAVAGCSSDSGPVEVTTA